MGEIQINRTNGGLGKRNDSQDAISGMVISTAAYDSNLVNKVIELNSLTDAIAQGITPALDTTHTTKVYAEVAEFYRIAPGVKLFLLVLNSSATLTAVADVANASNLVKLLRSQEAAGKIRQVAIGADDAVSTSFGDILTRTVNGQVVTHTGAIVKAQALALAEEALKRPVHIIVEGKHFTGTGTNALDLREANCNHVAVYIGKNSTPTGTAKNASIGTLLGMEARRKVNECVGYVGEDNSPLGGNIADSENYVNPKLSSDLAISSYTDTDFTQLDNKGYIFPKTYVGVPGVFLNDSHTCAAKSDDYSTIENVRTIQKAIRTVYKALVPYINSTIKINEDGTLPQTVCSHFQNVANVAVRKEMGAFDEISSVDSYVNPNQNLLATSEIQIEVQIIPTGVARKIIVPIGFKNPFNS